MINSDKRLNSKVDEELTSYINNKCPYIEQFHYKISENNEEISLIGFLEDTNSDKMMQDIHNLEIILNAKYLGITLILHTFTTIFKFN